jgi:iron uptake system component EfeO
MRKLLSITIAALPLILLACSSSSPPAVKPAMTDAQYREEAVQGMHDALLAEIQAMSAAVKDLQGAAPTPPDRGWDPAGDAQAITSMRAAWVRARTAYEHIEGALAPLFPDIDNSIDARYDDFMTQLASQGGDPDLFDDQGVTGMHAVERILYADVTPPRVVDFERSLPGYVPAAFPGTAAEAASFKGKLCARLLADVATLEEQWTPANINVAIAFQGLISLMNEQREKVQKAAGGEEESRYSQRTMADLRDNLTGSQVVYAFFQPWIASRPSPGHNAKAEDGAAIDAQIEHGLTTLDEVYKAVKGDAIPEPPATWSAEAPSASDLATPFGELYTTVHDAVDPNRAGSVVAQMNDAAGVLGFPEFQAGQ